MRLKITISMDNDALNILDLRAHELGLTRSKYLRLLITKDVENQHAIINKINRRKAPFYKYWAKKMAPYFGAITRLFIVRT